MFLHDAILEGVTTGWTDIPVDQLAERMGELDEVDSEGESGYQTEFNVSRAFAIMIHSTREVTHKNSFFVPSTTASLQPKG